MCIRDSSWCLRQGLRLTASDVGGDRGRKLLFLTHTGDVWVKRLNKSGGEP